MSDEKPKTSMESIAPLLKDVYQDYITTQLSSNLIFFGAWKPEPLTRKQKFIRKCKRFWNHIPDFFAYIAEYRYEEWRYWDKDGF